MKTKKGKEIPRLSPGQYVICQVFRDVRERAKVERVLWDGFITSERARMLYTDYGKTWWLSLSSCYQTHPKLKQAKEELSEAVLDWGECHPEDAGRLWDDVTRKMRTLCKVAFSLGSESSLRSYDEETDQMFYEGLEAIR